jgi:hypothetical protein
MEKLLNFPEETRYSQAPLDVMGTRSTDFPCRRTLTERAKQQSLRENNM